MSEPGEQYFINQIGQTVAVKPENVKAAIEAGYLPAGEEQAKDFQKEEKYGTTGQQFKTFGEGAAQALTLGTSTWAEKALGVNPEDIHGREEVNPATHFAGEITGVAVPLIATGGAAAGAEGASGALGAARAASEFTAPSLIGKLGEGAAKIAEDVLPEATSGLGRIARKAALGGAQAGTEGALYGVGHVVHEAGLGDPNLTWQSAAEEVGLSGLLGAGIGMGGGILSGLTREAAAGPIGEKLENWANTFEANQNIKTAAGPGKGRKALSWLYKKYGPEGAQKMGEEAGELGLIGTLDKPATVYEKAESMMDDVGPKIDQGLARVDALPEAAHPKVGDVLGRIEKKVLKDVDVVGGDEGVVNRVKSELESYKAKLGGEDAKITFGQMNDIRRNLGKRIYGLNGDLTVSTAYKGALRDLANGFGDEVMGGIDASGGDSGALKALNRQYSVAATIGHIAEQGMSSAGLSGVPLSAVLTAGAGLVHGGPLGAAALGVGTMLAKRYGPQVLAAGARGVRNLVDKGGAEALVNKTADLIAAERAAGSEVAATGASRMAKAFDIASRKLEPVVSPIGDAARDAIQDKVGKVERRATSDVETVAALSRLHRANTKVQDRVNGLAGKLVSGSKLTKAESGELSAHLAASREKGADSSLQKVHALANNPDLMNEHIQKLSGDLTQHAPDIAQAAAVHLSKTVGYLNQKFPAMPKMGPMGPILKMPKSQMMQFHKIKGVIESPTHLLKHASAGTLTPELVQAVQATAPERLAQMQQAVLEKVSEHPDSVPYRSRLGISMLMGQDMDGTLSQKAISSAQLTYQMPSAKNPMDQQGGGVKPSQTGLGKLNMASRSELPGQGADSRRRNA